jgi:hypothetical protein
LFEGNHKGIRIEKLRHGEKAPEVKNWGAVNHAAGQVRDVVQQAKRVPILSLRTTPPQPEQE